MALTQHFATRLGILEPRHDTTEKREKHTPEQGACLGVKTTPETSALELFLKYTAVASTGSDQDISFVSFCCFSPCSNGAMTRLCRVQVPVSQGKSKSQRGRSEFPGCTTTPIGTPKLTALFWHIQNVTEEGFDEAWSKFLK